MTTVKLSVKELGTPIVRRGSLIRSGLFNEPEIGATLHSVIQASYKEDPTYEKEVHLTGEFKAGSYTFKVTGRADGIFNRAVPEVEEIKTTFSRKALIDLLQQTPEHPYRLQSLIYAHLYYLKTGLIPQCRILIYSLIEQDQESFPIEYDPVKFELWLTQKFEHLVIEEEYKAKRKLRRIKLAESIAFPFERMRPHQDKLMETVAEACSKASSVMIQAPTGIGKTMGTLLPALKEALSRGTQLIYLAPKNAQFEVVTDAIKSIQAAGHPVKLLVLTAQSKMCLSELSECKPEGCAFAEGYYDKLEENKLLPKLFKNGLLDKPKLLQFGRKNQVCSYEISMESIEEADIIVGDYNYVFGHQAGLSRIFLDRSRTESLNLVIDEAHNLYQRGMDYFSPSIFLQSLKEACDTVVPDALTKKWQGLTKRIQSLIQSYRPPVAVSQPVELDVKKFDDIRGRLLSFLMDYLGQKDDMPRQDKVLWLYRTWSEFALILGSMGDASVVSWIFDATGERIAVTCCNPSAHLRSRMAHFNSVIAFSATMKPAAFYRQLSGFQDDTPFIEFPTAFPPENRKLLIIPQVSTAYRDRDTNYQKIAEAISRMMRLEPGHYLAFFPSFQFIRAIRSYFQLPEYKILAQEASMSADQAQNFILHLDDEEESVLILGVQGGMLAEGIDYDSNRLKGVFVVGPGLPSISYERDLLRSYYDKNFGSGFSYAYVYPGMAKSIQAAGRVIRSETKRGLVVLLDYRFIQPEYSVTMPSYWFEKDSRELVQEGLVDKIKTFWNSNPLQGSSTMDLREGSGPS